jgi:hypothetical protein
MVKDLWAYVNGAHRNRLRGAAIGGASSEL